jgi:hypothetical protein
MLPNKSDLAISHGILLVDSVSLVSNRAPIDAAHVGADAGVFPNSARNGIIIKKYHG